MSLPTTQIVLVSSLRTLELSAKAMQVSPKPPALCPTSQQLICLLVPCHGTVFPWAPGKFPPLFQHLSALGKLKTVTRMMQSTTVSI